MISEKKLCAIKSEIYRNGIKVSLEINIGIL
jgi:hypothetical protein